MSPQRCGMTAATSLARRISSLPEAAILPSFCRLNCQRRQANRELFSFRVPPLEGSPVWGCGSVPSVLLLPFRRFFHKRLDIFRSVSVVMRPFPRITEVLLSGLQRSERTQITVPPGIESIRLKNHDVPCCIGIRNRHFGEADAGTSGILD